MQRKKSGTTRSDALPRKVMSGASSMEEPWGSDSFIFLQSWGMSSLGLPPRCVIGIPLGIMSSNWHFSVWEKLVDAIFLVNVESLPVDVGCMKERALSYIYTRGLWICEDVSRECKSSVVLAPATRKGG